ncbi:MAG: hypothetical protein ACE5HP_08745 [Gemmatimonadota bacterium]
MFVEATEVLECPRCRVGPGLVAVVDEMRERRVVTGYVGCPLCEARYPIRERAVDFGPVPNGGREAGASLPYGKPRGAGPTERREEGPGGAVGEKVRAEPRIGEGSEALELAALLGRQPSGGYVLLGPAFLSAATTVGRTCGVEVLALAEGPGREEEQVTRLLGASATALPVAAGRLRGVVLGGDAAEEVQEAVRALEVGARLVVRSPSVDTREAVAGLPVEILVAEERAIVAVRSGDAGAG